MTDEFQRMHLRLEELQREIDAQFGTGAKGRQLNALVREIRGDWRQAQDAVNTLVRIQTALGLAPLFMEHKQPYKSHAEISALMTAGVLHHATFIQKTPWHLRFYKGLLAAMEPQPQSVLEIGVKGGGSTAFWKALFPAATVVGLDLKLRPWLQGQPSADGVIYVEGDQTDVPRLHEIADQYGPFDLVIDDGSHISGDQATTIRALLPRVRPGGFYVIEDIHATVKSTSTRDVDFGDDIWADFTVAALQWLRRGPAPSASTGATLARDLKGWIAELVIGRQVLAVRAKDPAVEA